MFNLMQRCGLVRLGACAVLASACSIGACNPLLPPQVVPRYHWDFFKIRPDAAPKEKAFKDCEADARRRNRFVSDGYMQGYNVAGDVLTCMKWEGWGQSTRAVTFEPIQRVRDMP